MRATVKPIKRTPGEIRAGKPLMLRITVEAPEDRQTVTMFEQFGTGVAGDRARSYMRAVADRLAGRTAPRPRATLSPDYALHYAQNPSDLGEHNPEL